MAKKNPAATGDVMPPAKTTAKKPRGPRGIKLVVPPEVEQKLGTLSELHANLKRTDLQTRFLSLAGPRVVVALDSSLVELAELLESERTARVNAVMGIVAPTANVAPDLDDPNYVPLDDETAQ